MIGTKFSTRVAVFTRIRTIRMITFGFEDLLLAAWGKFTIFLQSVGGVQILCSWQKTPRIFSSYFSMNNPRASLYAAFESKHIKSGLFIENLEF